MSELIQKNDNRATIRWKLLTGASALALTAYVSSANVAKAEDTDRPTDLDRTGRTDGTATGLVELLSRRLSCRSRRQSAAVSLSASDLSVGIFTDNQRPPRFAFGFEGKITFQPEDSDWIFSAGIRYGRSHANRHIHHQGRRQQYVHLLRMAHPVLPVATLCSAVSPTYEWTVERAPCDSRFHGGQGCRHRHVRPVRMVHRSIARRPLRAILGRFGCRHIRRGPAF